MSATLVVEELGEGFFCTRTRVVDAEQRSAYVNNAKFNDAYAGEPLEGKNCSEVSHAQLRRGEDHLDGRITAVGDCQM